MKTKNKVKLELKNWLTDIAKKTIPDTFQCNPSLVFDEDINEDALTNAWLKSETSYIYNVSVLAVIDRNKCDFVDLFIASQKNENYSPTFIGHLKFPQGENDDIARVLKRAINLTKYMHPVFEDR